MVIELNESFVVTGNPTGDLILFKQGGWTFELVQQLDNWGIKSYRTATAARLKECQHPPVKTLIEET